MNDVILEDASAKMADDNAASVTVTLAAVSGKRHVIFGFAGSAVGQTAKVQLIFTSTVKQELEVAAGAIGGLMFPVGVRAAVNEAVTVVTTPAAAAQCNANVIYRTINDPSTR